MVRPDRIDNAAPLRKVSKEISEEPPRSSRRKVLLECGHQVLCGPQIPLRTRCMECAPGTDAGAKSPASPAEPAQTAVHREPGKSGRKKLSAEKRTVPRTIGLKPAQWEHFHARGGAPWLSQIVDGKGEEHFAALLAIADGSIRHTCGEVHTAASPQAKELSWPCAACAAVESAREWRARVSASQVKKARPSGGRL